MADEWERILSGIQSIWLRQIKQARRAKEERFGKTAKEAWSYYSEDHWSKIYAGQQEDEAQGKPFPELRDSWFRAVLNMTATYAHTYLPFIHHSAPRRTSLPRVPSLPAELYGLPPGSPIPISKPDLDRKTVCSFLDWWLNYTPEEFDLRREGRMAGMEFLVKGRGVLWQEVVDGPWGAMIASNYVSVDNLLIDPDAEDYRRDAGWICRVHRQSVWNVARMASEITGVTVDPHDIKTSYQSHRARAEADSEPEGLDASGMGAETLSVDGEDVASNDVCLWYEIYSRSGIGSVFDTASSELQEAASLFEGVGDHVWLALVPGMKHPLNLPPETAVAPDGQEALARQLAWPVPWYEDLTDPWPCALFDAYPDPRSPWPHSPLEHALPLQRFLDFAISFLMNRVRVTSRAIILCSEEIPEEVREAILEGYDNELVVTKGRLAKELGELLSFIKHPEMNRDLMEVIALAQSLFRQMTGLDEMMFGGGGPTQIRSSAEAQIRQNNLQVRPGDLAECFEAGMAAAARKEGGATRLLVGPETVAPAMGEQWDPENPMQSPMAMAWATLVNVREPRLAWLDVSFSIAAASGRKPDEKKLMSDLSDTAQYLAPALLQRGMADGNFQSFNAWMKLVLAPALKIDVDSMLLSPIMPPQPPGPPGQGEDQQAPTDEEQPPPQEAPPQETSGTPA